MEHFPPMVYDNLNVVGASLGYNASLLGDNLEVCKLTNVWASIISTFCNYSKMVWTKE